MPHFPLIGKARQRELNSGAPKDWHFAVPVAFDMTIPIDPPQLYAVVSSWRDSDVIGATVRNCFAQGCSRVFLLDNDSQDGTVETAVNQGAEIGRIYKTDLYDDDLRIVLENEIIREETERAKLPDLWWMSLDADEFPFPSPHDGKVFVIVKQRVIDLLIGLPRGIRVVGGDAVDLYPTIDDPTIGTTKAEYVAGTHPASTMTHGHWRRGGVNKYCGCGHWKHVLARYFDGAWDIAQSRGNHHPHFRPGTACPCEAMGLSVDMFHAPIRAKEHTMSRLEALCGRSEARVDGLRVPRSHGDSLITGNQGAIKRYRSMEAIYAGRWDEVDYPHTQAWGRSVRGVTLYPWRTLVPSQATRFQECLPGPSAILIGRGPVCAVCGGSGQIDLPHGQFCKESGEIVGECLNIGTRMVPCPKCKNRIELVEGK